MAARLRDPLRDRIKSAINSLYEPIFFFGTVKRHEKKKKKKKGFKKNLLYVQ
jgi:hypothetical protein